MSSVDAYLLATRGTKARILEPVPVELRWVSQMYASICAGLNIPEKDRPLFCLVDSPRKGAEYLVTETESFVLFDKGLLVELERLLLGYHSRYKRMEYVHACAMHNLTTEYLAFGRSMEAHICACQARRSFAGTRPRQPNFKAVVQGIHVSVAFILAHELVHYIVRNKDPFGGAWNRATDPWAEILVTAFRTMDGKKMNELWKSRYGGDCPRIPNLNMEAASAHEASYDINKEDAYCDFNAYNVTIHLLERIIPKSVVFENIFLLFRNLRVFAYLREVARSTTIARFNEVSIDEVTHLQTRHFILRQWWNAERRAGFNNDLISDISDKHDKIVDLPIIGIYPSALETLFHEQSLVAEANLATCSFSSDELETHLTSLLSSVALSSYSRA